MVSTAYTKCPKCEAVYSYTDMTVENTSGSEFWSDGYCIAPNRKELVKFAKCQACGTFFWLKENTIQEAVDLPEIKNLDNTWSLDNIGNIEIDFITDALRLGLASSNKKEIFLRMKMWHTINHVIRKYNSQSFFKIIKQKLFETAEYKESLKLYGANLTLKNNNLVRLANLLKLDKKESTNFLLLAEIYRELGDFSKAMIFGHKAETAPNANANRIALLKQNITIKSKIAYKL